MVHLGCWLVLITAMLGTIFVAANERQETKCTYTMDKDGLHANCSNLSLTKLPSYIHPNVTSIDLSENDIKIIPNNSFNTFKQLRILRINSNTINTLEACAFQGCHRLALLDLSDNILKLSYESYPETVFDDLKNLKWLDLRSNSKGSTDTYPGRIFHDLKKLKTLKIDTFRQTIFGPSFSHLKSLWKLVLGGDDCDAKILLNETFASLSNSSLEILNLTYCKLIEIEAGTFLPLSKLQELIMPFTSPIGVQNVLKSFFPFVGRNMRVLDFQKVHVKSSLSSYTRLTDAVIREKDLQYLAQICVEQIIISRNNLIYIDMFSLMSKPFSRCLKELDISSNSLIASVLEFYLATTSFGNIQSVDISMQGRVFNTPNVNEISKQLIRVPRKQAFHIRAEKPNSFIKILNESRQMDEIVINIPKNLKHINASSVSHSAGTILGNFTITNGHSLNSINASFLGLGEVNMRITGLEQLIELDISGNMNLQLQDSFFDSFPFLETLFMKYLSFRQETVLQTKRFFPPLKKLKHLYLSHNKLSSLPLHCFDSNPALVFLDLSHNVFSSIPFDFVSTPHLLSLDMSSNALRKIDRITRMNIEYHTEDVNGSFHLQLHGNLLSCGCGSFDFLVWMHETKVMLDNNRNFSCLLANGDVSNTKRETDRIIHLWRNCIGQSLFYISLSVFTFLVCGILTTLLVKTNRTSLIECFMDLLRKQIEPKQRHQYEKDLYVYYPDYDYQWVCHCLRPILEEQNLRLFIPDRDLDPGGNTAVDITKHIDKSWKVLLYFTMNFQTDQWGIYTMSTAISAMNNKNRDRIILLLPEDQYPRVPECLLRVVPESCILRVPGQLTRNDPFWDDLYTLVVQKLEF